MLVAQRVGKAVKKTDVGPGHAVLVRGCSRFSRVSGVGVVVVAVFPARKKAMR